MRKVAKWSLIGAGGLAFLFVLALVVMVTVIDLNEYKDRIAQAVEHTTGRTLTFDGDLNLLVFPRFGVELGGLTLSNAEGFGPEPMITTASGRVTIQTFPLLFGKVKFGDLRLDELDLKLARKADGTTNWADLVGRSPETSSESDPFDIEPFSLEVGDVSITDARFQWDDRMTDTAFVLSGLTVSTGKVRQGALFPVDVNLAFACPAPNVKGTISLSGKSSIDMENREYSHMDMKLKVDAEGEVIPGGKTKASVNLKFLTLNFNEERAQVSGLKASSYGVTVHADATVQGITKSVEKMAGVITLDPFNAKKTLAALGEELPATADPKALTRLNGMVDFAYESGVLTVNALEANADDARIVAKGRAEAAGALPFVFARIDVGTLDLDRYLPTGHAGTTRNSKKKAANGEKDDTILPVDVIRNLAFDVEARVAKLTIGKANVTNVVAKLDAKDGIVRLKSVSMDAYDGVIRGTSIVNAQGPTPRSGMTATIEKVDVGGLSRDMTGNSKRAGMLDFKLAASSVGSRVYDILSNTNGKFDFHLADGVFPGVDLTRMARQTHKRKSEGGKVEAAKTDSTKFGAITGTGVIRKGVVRNRDLEVKAPGLRATGAGAVYLPTREIDYMVKAKLVPQAEGQGGKDSDDLIGVMVPIHVTGTLENPYYWVSITEYVKALGGMVLDVAGSVFDGVKGAVESVGDALDDSGSSSKSGSSKGKFLGIF
ncbi:AsmA family protein [Pseudodesulfovibrio sediminis]|uniref:Cell envelope biogenesis protein AsmA n=1 Tax=Pseudodesulfovibrio sediminis TaxID=2810563 RepID=A0ABN6ENQ1_9BACT|nr:AsmA family protein [Pseudodesulfovibrio sediminis]BCS87886.1 cell envelope biogenesis protein AsmA [Pseudodesulfovibrio sediminis]